MADTVQTKSSRVKEKAGLVRSVFLSAPTRTDTSIIRKVLEEEGVRVVDFGDLIKPGQRIQELLVRGMREVDAVIVVLGERPKNSNVFYEMGMADAMGKPVLVISTDVLDPSDDLDSHPYIRARYDDWEALRFGLVPFLRAARHGRKTDRVEKPSTKPIGDLADRLLVRLRSKQPIGEEELAATIAEALHASGVQIQATRPRTEVGEAPHARHGCVVGGPHVFRRQPFLH